MLDPLDRHDFPELSSYPDVGRFLTPHLNVHIQSYFKFDTLYMGWIASRFERCSADDQICFPIAVRVPSPCFALPLMRCDTATACRSAQFISFLSERLFPIVCTSLLLRANSPNVQCSCTCMCRNISSLLGPRKIYFPKVL